jgi:FkbM family methyltransferase
VRKLKEIARALAPRILWDGAKKIRDAIWARRIEPLLSRYFGLQELDKKLEKYLDFDGGFFVEVGGWDGTTFSNSLYFERYRRWRGVLIEPSPTEFLKCTRDRPLAKVFCYACVPFDYADKYVPMIFCASMTVTNIGGAKGVLFDRHEHVRVGRQFLFGGEDVFEFGAIAKPLSRILSENEINQRIDLLILDVEGYELSVLEGLDFDLHAPRYICVEIWHAEGISKFLRERRYVFVEQLSKHDYLYKHNDI